MAYVNIPAIADAARAFAADLIGSSYFSRVKVAVGVEGAAVDVSVANPLPVSGTVALDAPTLAALENTGVAVSALPANGRTVVEYTLADSIRPAVVAGSNAFVLPTLGASRVVFVLASVRTFIRTGTGGITAAVAAGSMPIPPDVPFHFIVPAGHTHIAVIRDAASDGSISVIRAID
jgi:hypothetical protein